MSAQVLEFAQAVAPFFAEALKPEPVYVDTHETTINLDNSGDPQRAEGHDLLWDIKIYPSPEPGWLDIFINGEDAELEAFEGLDDAIEQAQEWCWKQHEEIVKEMNYAIRNSTNRIW